MQARALDYGCGRVVDSDASILSSETMLFANVSIHRLFYIVTFTHVVTPCNIASTAARLLGVHSVQLRSWNLHLGPMSRMC